MLTRRILLSHAGLGAAAIVASAGLTTLPALAHNGNGNNGNGNNGNGHGNDPTLRRRREQRHDRKERRRDRRRK
jgi:hypothetical protein